MKKIPYICLILLVLGLMIPFSSAEATEIIKIDEQTGFSFQSLLSIFVKILLVIILWRIIMTILNLFVFKKKPTKKAPTEDAQ